MAKNLLTVEQDKWLRENAEGFSSKQLADKMNIVFGTDFDGEQIRCYKKNHRIRSGRIVKPDFKNRLMTDEQEAWLIDHAKGISNHDLTEMLNSAFGTMFTDQQIKRFKKNHKIKSGLTGRWGERPVPVQNEENMRKFLEAGKKTRFKNGGVPANRTEIGTVRYRNNPGYKFIKVGPNGTDWILYHRWIWEQHYGPIPEGMNITFKDGDSKNCDIGNLIMITDGEIQIMNKMNLYTKGPLNEIGIMIAKTEAEIGRRKRNEKKP